MSARDGSRIAIGVRVSGNIRGQRFTGRVCGMGIRDDRVESVMVRTDQPLKTPTGREVFLAHVTGELVSELTLQEAGLSEPAPPPATIENYPGELAMLRGVLGVVRSIARHGDLVETEGVRELRRIIAEHHADERAAYEQVAHGEKDTAPAATSTPQPVELLALATVLEIPRPGNALPLQLIRSHGHADRWAIANREGRRWNRELGWCPETGSIADDRLRDTSRFTLAEAVPLARQLAEAAEPKLCPPCKRGDCEECLTPDRPPHLNPYTCHTPAAGPCPRPTGPVDEGYDYGIPGGDAG